MKTVGIRALKKRLSEYLRQMRLGESVPVQDRGAIYVALPRARRGKRNSAELLDEERGSR
jgi:antitoxin (DNA-binding transcriptional repressor) of toxin-antitoxin stability system